MKKSRLSAIVIIMIVSVATFLISCTGKDDDLADAKELQQKSETAVADVACCFSADTLPVETLSQTEIDALLLMREEELMARDVYVYLSGLYSTPVFANISLSEQQHASAIAALLVKYGLDDIAADHQAGVFVNQELQELYNSLIAMGEESITGAFTAGATIEDMDIFDLMQLSEQVDNADILLVFANLTKGSRNHLRSFVAHLLKVGVNYQPQFISQDLFDEIINSPHE
ncbi:MAG: DUF2202 domain-containing protein [Lentimicrobium sp.]|nr:DUF2202 domain-containing protein [Lentimicrobium sp.]